MENLLKETIKILKEYRKEISDIINTIDKILQNNKKWEVVVKWLKE